MSNTHILKCLHKIHQCSYFQFSITWHGKNNTFFEINENSFLNYISVHLDLLTPCYGDGVHPYTPNYPSFSEMEIFDPTNEDVYAFMFDLISEAKSTFKDPFIHLGMDEVTYNCWYE